MVYSRSVYEPDPEPTMLPILSADVGTKLYPPQLALICADKRADVLSEKVYAYYLHYLVRGKMAENYMALYNRVLNTGSASVEKK